MTSNDAPNFAQLLVMTGETYRVEVTAAKVQMYFAALNRFSYEQVTTAIAQHMASNKFFPSAAEIAAHVPLDMTDPFNQLYEVLARYYNLDSKIKRDSAKWESWCDELGRYKRHIHRLVIQIRGGGLDIKSRAMPNLQDLADALRDIARQHKIDSESDAIKREREQAALVHKQALERQASGGTDIQVTIRPEEVEQANFELDNMAKMEKPILPGIPACMDIVRVANAGVMHRDHKIFLMNQPKLLDQLKHLGLKTTEEKQN